MKNVSKTMLVLLGCALLVGSFAQSALAGRPSLPCKAGVAFSKAVVGHIEDYTFQNGLVTEKQSYFKVDGEVKPNGCTFEYTKDSHSEQCMLIVMNAAPGVTATNDMDITCVMEKDNSQTVGKPNADYRKIIPVCPTKGVNDWCSNNTTDLGAKEGEFFDKMKSSNKVAFFGCIGDSSSDSTVGKVFCSAATSSNQNESFFQLAFDKKAMGQSYGSGHGGTSDGPGASSGAAKSFGAGFKKGLFGK